jgi:endonuclease I
MNKKITLLFLLSITFGVAQIPSGYYDSALLPTPLTGYTLKTELHNIIDNNTNSSGTASYGDMWTLFTQPGFRDNYYENNSSLLDIYSEIPSGADSYEYTSTADQCGGSTPSSEGGCYNREHTIPQSVFGGSNTYPMYSDAHFVIPTDNRVNGWRDNYPFGKVVSSSGVQCTNGTLGNVSSTPCYTTNQSRIGNNLNSGYSAGYSGVVFEPIDEFKGDIARALLYYGTRYEDQVTSWSYVMFNGSSNQVYTNTFLNILITWHLNDPVSAYEIAKNNAVYTFQGNRNPFIDHPEFVCQIYTTQCATLSSESFASLNDVSIYPNPTSNGSFSISSAIELNTITIYNVNGQIIQEIKNPSTIGNETYNVNNLSTGFYLVQLASENGSITKKVIVN